MTLGEVALVGTARARQPAATGTAVDALVEPLADVTVERRLLLAAGALDVFRRAGRMVREVKPLPPPAPLDDRPPCADAATLILREMFADHPVLLIEAFGLLARAGQRLPSTLLVPVLELSDAALRAAARPVLGARGGWLAAHRDIWSWARESAVEDGLEQLQRVWLEGPLDERLEIIERVRASHPDVAREWIADVWPREKSQVRVELVSRLAPGLSPADESWLTAALRDRTAAVRGVAASLLARLPDSAAAARAIDRADPFLDWSGASGTGVWSRVKSAVGGTESRGRLQVSPPTAVDPAWESDGLSIKPPRGAGKRAHWLVQALERVAPSHWVRRFDASPADLVRAAWESEWGTAVLLAWSRAAVLHGDAEWTTALWDAWVSHENHDDPGYPDIRRDVLMMLLAEMPIDAAEPRVAALLNQPALASTIDLAEALTRFPMPWRETLAVKVLDVIEQALSRALEPTAVYLPDVLRAAGPALPASLLARAFTIAGPQPVSLTARQLRELDLFLTRVRLRRRLHEETHR